MPGEHNLPQSEVIRAILLEDGAVLCGCPAPGAGRGGDPRAGHTQPEVIRAIRWPWIHIA